MKCTMMSLSLAFALAGGALAQGAMTEGEVRKVDAAAGKITLKHGEIKSLDMPPMTMVFRVKDPALLARCRPATASSSRPRRSTASTPSPRSPRRPDTPSRSKA